MLHTAPTTLSELNLPPWTEVSFGLFKINEVISK